MCVRTGRPHPVYYPILNRELVRESILFASNVSLLYACNFFFRTGMNDLTFVLWQTIEFDLLLLNFMCASMKCRVFYYVWGGYLYYVGTYQNQDTNWYIGTFVRFGSTYCLLLFFFFCRMNPFLTSISPGVFFFALENHTYLIPISNRLKELHTFLES